MAARHFPDMPAYLDNARRAVEFLRRAHRNPATGGYAWQLRWEGGRAEVLDATNHCYGLAFVLLAYAHALVAGIGEAGAWLDETFDADGAALLAARRTASTPTRRRRTGSLRPTAARTPTCTPPRPASRPTRPPGERRFLDRAELVATNITQRQAALTDGLMIWEHYKSDWSVDWDYNRNDMTNIFRPWGYQPGHFTEWAKLLILLERQRPLPWLLPRAEALFDARVPARVGRRARWPVLRLRARLQHLRRPQVPLGAVREPGHGRSARPSHRAGEVLGLVRPAVGVLLAALDRPRARRVVSHCSRATTSTPPTRRARPARWTTTPPARATRS